jgi:hypothetical protein
MPLRRPLIALFCAPILPALVPAWFSYANRTYHPVSAFVFFWGILCVIQLGIGIPAFRLFNRLKLKGILAYLLLGFFAVYIPAFALCLYQWSERNYELGTVMIALVYAGLLGSFTALMFWLLARPDKLA